MDLPFAGYLCCGLALINKRGAAHQAMFQEGGPGRLHLGPSVSNRAINITGAQVPVSEFLILLATCVVKGVSLVLQILLQADALGAVRGH
ncbi:MAG: hypothetical protein JWN14_304 [Chthonomonadales bacterium]|nr:hypothetical protein [Chthonomonadales bacterium]